MTLKINLFKLVSILFLVFVLLHFFSCGASSSKNTNGSNNNGVVKFKMDGTEWVSGPPGHPELKYEEEATTDGSSMVRIEAFAENGSYLALTVFRPSGIGPGTYPIKQQGMGGFYKDNYNEGGGFVTNGMRDNPGVITISSLSDERVAGTFNFPIRNSGDPEDIRHISEGSFDLKFSSY